MPSQHQSIDTQQWPAKHPACTTSHHACKGRGVRLKNANYVHKTSCAKSCQHDPGIAHFSLVVAEGGNLKKGISCGVDRDESNQHGIGHSAAHRYVPQHPSFRDMHHQQQEPERHAQHPWSRTQGARQEDISDASWPIGDELESTKRWPIPSSPEWCLLRKAHPESTAMARRPPELFECQITQSRF